MGRSPTAGSSFPYYDMRTYFPSRTLAPSAEVLMSNLAMSASHLHSQHFVECCLDGGRQQASYPKAGNTGW